MFVAVPNAFGFACIVLILRWQTSFRAPIIVSNYQETLMNKEQIKGRMEEAKPKVKEANGKHLNTVQARRVLKAPLPWIINSYMPRIGSLKAHTTQQNKHVEIHDRIFMRPSTETKPAHWFYRTSEGLMGPFDSNKTAMATLAIFVERFKAAGEGVRLEAVEPT
jgi:hypothetical protein